MDLRKQYIGAHRHLLSDDIVPSRVTWISPSNIAIIKYWGKHGIQLPSNPSLSFTLSEAITEMTIAYEPRANAKEKFGVSYTFEGEIQEAFKDRITTFLSSVSDIFPFLSQLNLDIQSRNTFPHSSGIASSASSMSALALCLCTIEEKLFALNNTDAEFRQKASYVARLASGSACRSIFPSASVWGNTPSIDLSNDEFAVPADSLLHPLFKNFKDSILIVNAGEKQVSSREGHRLMIDHPFAQNRFIQAKKRIEDLIRTLKSGDLEQFVRITENEALTLHGLMMSSNRSYLLMHPNTIEIINRIRFFRDRLKIPVCFSLDAGPNIHLLYPENEEKRVVKFIKDELVLFCEAGKWIDDCMGEGPVQTV